MESSMVRNDDDASERKAPLATGKQIDPGRRKMLKGTAGSLIIAAGTGFKGACSVWGQVEGVKKGGGTVPYRLPMGRWIISTATSTSTTWRFMRICPAHRSAEGSRSRPCGRKGSNESFQRVGVWSTSATAAIQP